MKHTVETGQRPQSADGFPDPVRGIEAARRVTEHGDALGARRPAVLPGDARRAPPVRARARRAAAEGAEPGGTGSTGRGALQRDRAVGSRRRSGPRDRTRTAPRGIGSSDPEVPHEIVPQSTDRASPDSRRPAGIAVTTQGASHAFIQDDPGPLGPRRRRGDRMPRHGRDHGGGDARPGGGQGAGGPGRPARRPTRAAPTCLTCHEDQERGAHDGPALPRVPGRHPDVAQGLPGLPRRYEGRRWAARAATARARRTPTRAATRRRSGASPALSPEGRERDLRQLPLPHQAHALGGQPARPAQRRLHDVPQHPRRRGRQAAQGRRRDGAVRTLPPHDRQQAAQVQPHAGARGQAVLLVVPQRARHRRT